VAGVVLALLPGVAQAAPGDLDPSFSGDGKAAFQRGRLDLVTAGLEPLVQSDGKLVVVVGGVSSNGAVVLTRLHPDGRIDRSFGDGGRAVLTPGVFSLVTGATLQGDAIVVVGGVLPLGGNAPDTLVARFTADGRPDPSFGSNGVEVVDVGGADLARSVALGAGGSLLVAGASEPDAYIAKMDGSGVLDPSFGTAGVRRIATGQATNSTIRPGIAPTAGGGAVIVFTDVGYAPTVVTRLVRVTSTGAFDLTFGGTGEVILDVSAQAEQGVRVLIQGARTFAITQLSGDAWITALEPDGDVDVLWGVSGERLVPLAGASSTVTDAALDTAGRLVIVGSAIDGAAVRWEMMRVLVDGSLDNGFAVTGHLDRSVDGVSGASGVAAHSSGYALAGASGEDLAVMHLTSAGTATPGFGTAGVRTITVSDDTATEARDVIIDPDGRTVAISATTRGSRPTEATVWRLTPSGRLDRTFGRRGVTTARVDGRRLTPDAIRRLDDGRYLVAMTMADDTRTWVVLARYTRTGRPDTTFGPQGRRIVAGSQITPTSPVQLEIDDRGRYVVAAADTTGVHVVRLRPSGRPDRTFGPQGRRFVGTEPTEFPWLVELAVLTSGRIAIVDAGTMRTIRFRPGGKPDVAFGPGGARPLAVPASFTNPTASMTREGRIVLSAPLDGGGTSIARLRPDGSLDGGFGAGGVVTLAPSSGVLYDLPVVLARGDGSVIAAGLVGTAQQGLSTINSVIVRLAPNGAFDSSFSGDGVRIVDGVPGAADLSRAVSVRGQRMVVAGGSFEPGSRLLLARLRF
jgi:uncharacterized delta-60 repeat protein